MHVARYANPKPDLGPSLCRSVDAFSDPSLQEIHNVMPTFSKTHRWQGITQCLSQPLPPTPHLQAPKILVRILVRATSNVPQPPEHILFYHANQWEDFNVHRTSLKLSTRLQPRSVMYLGSGGYLAEARQLVGIDMTIGHPMLAYEFVSCGARSGKCFSNTGQINPQSEEQWVPSH